MTPLIPEVFKSVQQRLRTIRRLYGAGGRSDDYLELEELARESHQALTRVNKNLLRMIEIERSLNAAGELTGSREMQLCRQLVKQLQELSGVENPAAQNETTASRSPDSSACD